VLSDDGASLYVVNYQSDSISKVRTDTMEVVETVKVDHHPIGITYDPATKRVWVANYSGTIMVFQD
jgi:YVTN family beta-propeller protein